MLQYPVYIQSVTNLSDARYAAGMGVHLIGFSFDLRNSRKTDFVLFEGIKSWISGVKIVVELGSTSLEDSQLIIASTNPDTVLVDSNNSSFYEVIDRQIIYKMMLSEPISSFPPKGARVLVVSEKANDELSNYHSKLRDFVENYGYRLWIGFGFDSSNIHETAQVYRPAGFALKGGDEIAPGLKSFDELADILEAIEVD